MVVAFLAAWAQLRWGFRRLGGGDEEDASALLLAAGIGGIVGAKIYYAALYGDWRLLMDRSGLVWYGGFLLGAVAVVWVVRRRRLPGGNAGGGRRVSFGSSLMSRNMAPVATPIKGFPDTREEPTGLPRPAADSSSVARGGTRSGRSRRRAARRTRSRAG